MRPVSEFDGQNGVLHEIRGSENGTLLGTRTWTVTECQPKWYETSSFNGWVCWRENHLFCNRDYRITNTALDCQFYPAGVGRHEAHMTMPHGCHMLHHSTMDWLLGPYKSENVFHVLYKPWSRISFTKRCCIKTIVFLRSLQPSFTCTGIFLGLYTILI
jgi:hypothetical protein